MQVFFHLEVCPWNVDTRWSAQTTYDGTRVVEIGETMEQAASNLSEAIRELTKVKRVLWYEGSMA